MYRVLLAGALVWLWLIGTGEAVIYHVAPGGSGTTCGNAAAGVGTALPTINQAMACPGPGDFVYLHAGTYNESVYSGSVPSGTAGNPVTVQAAPGETVIWRSQPGCTFPELGYLDNCRLTLYIYGAGNHDFTMKDIIIDGDNHQRNASIALDGAYGNEPYNLKFINMEIRFPQSQTFSMSHVKDTQVIGGKFHDTKIVPFDNRCLAAVGMYISHVTNVVLDGVEVYRAHGHGIQFYSGDEPVVAQDRGYNNVVKNSFFHENGLGEPDSTAPGCVYGGGAGIITGAETNISIYNTIFKNNGDTSVGGGTGGQAVLFGHAGFTDGALFGYNTVVDHFVTSSGAVEAQGGSQNVTMRDNIFWNTTGSQDLALNGTGGVQDHNWRSFNANPLFNADYTVQSGSLTLNQGIPIAGITTDKIGATRGNPSDLGVYEFGGTILPPGAGMVLTTNQCTGATGCTTGDPSFASTTPGNVNFLHLNPVAPATTPVSPARDSGTPIGTLTSDFNGKSRPDGPGVDKGAFEEAPVSAVIPPTPPGLRGLPYATTHFLIPQ